MPDKTTLLSILLELGLYALLVVGYFFVVLHFLGDWLMGLYVQDHRLYAMAALFLIIAQGVLLELVTSGLLGWIEGRRG